MRFYAILLAGMLVLPQMALAQESTIKRGKPGEALKQVRNGSPASSAGQGSLLDNTAPSILDDPFKARPQTAKPQIQAGSGPKPGQTFLPDGSRVITGSDGSVIKEGADGSFMEKRPDGQMRYRRPDGKEGFLNPDGTGVSPDGRKTEKRPDGSTAVTRPDGLGFEIKRDGTKVFKRSNGLETVRTPDGKIYMRDAKTGQSVRRELK